MFILKLTCLMWFYLIIIDIIDIFKNHKVYILCNLTLT